MAHSPSIITLLTDFGTKDEYVGVLKGVILRSNRNIVTVDISHHIPPQDTIAAAHILSRSFSYFPAETVHLIVVDPGVGSSRKILAMKAYNHYFVGPDNGVLSHLFRDDNAAVYQIDMGKWGGEKTSNTFHGRDIMAPAAAHLASTHCLLDIGEKISGSDCIKTLQQEPILLKNILLGGVVHVDHFGNLCTNITRADLEAFGPEPYQITIGNIVIPVISKSYSSKAGGSYLALFDSHDLLEISLNQGSAHKQLGLGTGTEVKVEKFPLD